MCTVLKSIAILGVVVTLFTHVSHVITWPNWLHEILTHWRELFSDFWSATASLIGLELSTHTARFLTICVFVFLAVMCANREASINAKLTKLGLVVTIAGLTFSAAVIVGALMIPVVSDKTLPKASTIYIGSNLVIAGVALAILLFAIVKRARWQDLAHQAWIFLALFALMTFIFMGHIIFHVIEQIDGRRVQTSIRTKTENYAMSCGMTIPFEAYKGGAVHVRSIPGTECCSSVELS